MTDLKTRKSEVAKGTRSRWQRSARARTASRCGSSSSSITSINHQTSSQTIIMIIKKRPLRGEYSSSGMIRSCKYRVRKRIVPHSPTGVIPDRIYLKNQIKWDIILKRAICWWEIFQLTAELEFQNFRISEIFKTIYLIFNYYIFNY